MQSAGWTLGKNMVCARQIESNLEQNKEPSTFRFRTGLTWDEVKQIVVIIHHRFPKYQYDWRDKKS
jgi:hypothetical protein